MTRRTAGSEGGPGKRAGRKASTAPRADLTRLHGEIGHIPPVEYEANYYTELKKPQVITTI
ncbi:hypothetical protein LK06_032195 [Streptomyces pluripotens]|nr:hypothetical protein LK06_032195 [Streptomyces pluripotens]